MSRSLLPLLLLLGTACGARMMPPYTNAWQLMKVEPGMDYGQVRKALEAPPADVLASHEDGLTVYTWYYLHPAYTLFDNRTPETLGDMDGDRESVRMKDLEKVYLVFDPNRLRWFVTDEALHLSPRSAASILLEGELLHRATKDPSSLLDLTHGVRIDEEEKKAGGPLLPLLGGK